MDDILIDQCTKKMSGTFSFLLWLFVFFWIWKAFQYVVEIRKLRHMHDFFYYLLRISDNNIQSVSWQEIVSRLMELRDANPATANGINAVHRRFIGNQSKQRMDAHDIANRLMRKENYLIALFNKDILDLTLPIPFLRNRQLFSRTLEWNIYLCIVDYVFNEHGQVRPLFLKDTHRRALSDGLRKRFIFAGFMNIFAAPFIVTYFLMHYFFRYFTEYQKNPAEIGTRQYNPLAEWKFREFNELWHLFQRRINMSYPFASRYVDQFPKDKTIQTARFVMFISGALIAILAIGSLLDPKLFLSFEITQDRTVLFYLGFLGAVWAVARGIVPEENLVFDPEFALREVTDFTHYKPAHWNGRLHSDEVRKEFAMLYQLKVVIFLEEILSMITTPFVLWFSLPKCSDRLIDFFREFTVHVDGIGYVCSFAVFDFKKGAMTSQPQNQAGGADLRDDYYATKDGKMLASYYGFMDNYATNPKPGVPYMHRSSKRRVYPPPSFHELTSPPFPAEMGGTGNVRHDRWDRQPHSAFRQLPGPAFGHHSAHRTPRFGAVGGQNSPLQSILLDPHHQPSASGFRSANRANTQSRYRQTRHPMADTIEDEDEDAPPTQDAVAAELGERLTDEGNLGESWKTTRAGALDDDEDEDEGQELGGEKGAGVLGLIYQFQKAQTDGRGVGAAGVNI
jgi:autophagy-related protein 9